MKNLWSTVVGLVSAFFVVASCTNTSDFSLNGQWQFRQANTSQNWLPATVPGTVHTDLFANGQIPDPLIGCNNMQLGWVDSLDWEYCRSFTIPRSFNAEEPIYLVFDGLDTYADVYVNDSLMLSANNMFRCWRVNCAGILNGGKNTIRVVFKSAVKEAARLTAAMGFKLPDGEWATVRKAPYHFGWDWGPRFVTCGIWKSVSLQQPKGINVENLAITTASADSVSAVLMLNFDFNPIAGKSYGVEVVDADTRKSLFNATINADSSRVSFCGHFNINSPKLWWPNGHGQQHRYNLKVLVTEGANKIYSQTCRVGIRTVQLVNEPDSIGESFYFEVNGRPMFAKGANVIPPHPFISQVFDSAWVAIAESAKRSHFNMVRVWGGGVYPPDVFFEACSERGILVWQDFMFACSMYPWSNGFIGNVRVEAEQQVKRLRAHTSLALWCGNNEIAEGWHNWGWQKGFSKSQVDSTWTGYNRLFNCELRSVVASFDPTRCYWPSSPKYGWGSKESMTHGDSHYWGVWWGIEPFSRFRQKVPRFMSEYGMQGAPSMQALRLFSNNGGLPDSVELRCHQKHSIGYETIRKYMDMEGFYPATLADWAYYSQVTQAIAYATAIEAQRLASPRCMGSLYWQLNDCWPAVSWSGIDCLGIWKAAQYTVSKYYETVIAGACISNGNVEVSLVSDSLNMVLGVATVRVINPEAVVLFERKQSVSLEPNRAYLVEQIDIERYGIDTTNCVVCVDFEADIGISFSSISFLGRVINSQVQNLGIQARIESSEEGGVVVLSTKYPAYFVQLSTDDERCRFSNNYLHLMPGREYRVKYTGENSGKINVRGVNNIFPISNPIVQ